MAYHACDEYLRRKYPRRHQLKNRLRYVLTHQDGFALWEGEGKESFCGFDEWRDSGRLPASGWRVRSLSEDPGFSTGHLRILTESERDDPAALVATIFNLVGQPLAVDDLVSVVSDFCDIRDTAPVSGPVKEDVSGERTEPQELDLQLDRRAWLRRVWEEIRELPVKQRIALLLNLRDESGCSAVTLMPFVGLATIAEIAATLEIPAEQLAGLWNRLPIDDTTVGELLGVTRQQVINLRKSARERLARRTKEFA